MIFYFFLFFSFITFFFFFLTFTTQWMRMDEYRHKISQLLFSLLFFFLMKTDLSISSKFKSPFNCENWHFNVSISIPPFDSVSFHAPEKVENVFLAITLWWSKKLAMSTLELIKNGIVITLSSIHNMSSKCWEFKFN